MSVKTETSNQLQASIHRRNQFSCYLEHLLNFLSPMFTNEWTGNKSTNSDKIIWMGSNSQRLKEDDIIHTCLLVNLLFIVLLILLFLTL